MAGIETIRHWPSVRSKPWLEDFLRACKRDDQVVAVIAMGSSIRVRGHPRSDLDILIIHRGKRRSTNAPLEVDVRQYDIRKVEQMAASGHEVIGWAIMFGIPLYDAGGLWRATVESWRLRLPLPSTADARRRADEALRQTKEFIQSGDENAASDLVLAALTQYVRAELIEHGEYPASRPELPGQLRAVSPGHLLADLLERSMYSPPTPEEQVELLESARTLLSTRKT